MGRVIPRAAGALFTMVGMIGVLIVVDWRLALGALVYVFLAVAVVVRGRHRAVGESSDEMGSYARLYGGIEERLTAAEDLRSNGAGAPRDVAVRRGQRRRDGQRRPPREGVPADVVGRSTARSPPVRSCR